MPNIIEQIVRITMDGDSTKAEVIGELIRCRDCKHKYVKDDLEDKWCYWVDTDPDDFCSMGERKERSEDGN